MEYIIAYWIVAAIATIFLYHKFTEPFNEWTKGEVVWLSVSSFLVGGIVIPLIAWFWLMDKITPDDWYEWYTEA